MAISGRRSVILLGLGTAGLAGLSFLYLDRMIFVGRCSWNGNSPAICWCTHRALPELPSGYREAAISWSHQSSVEYAHVVMTAAAWRALGHATGIEESTVRDAQNTKLADWLAAAAKESGWWAAIEAARQIAEGSLRIFVTAAPIVLREGMDLTKANSVMRQSCGDRPHFLYRSAQLQQAIQDTATGTWARLADASSSAYKSSVDATSSAWGWVKRQAGRLSPW